MKGSVTGHYVAIKPNVVEETIKEGALAGFVTGEGLDKNQKLRVEKGSTIGVVIDIGPDAFKTNDPDWKPWCNIGDTVHFVRYTSKFVEDHEDLDDEGRPRQIFITSDENIVWNEGKADE